MSGKGNIKAGQAYVELFADDSRLARGLRAAQKKLRSFGTAVNKIGLGTIAFGSAIVAPIIAATKSFADMGDKIGKTSKRIGVSVEALSELEYAASQSGASLEQIEGAFRGMERGIYNATKGTGEAKDAFDKLGVPIAEIAGLSPEQQFMVIGESLSRVQDETKRAAMAMAIFGDAGTQLLPMFRDGARGVDELRQKARDLGLVLTSEDVQSAEAFTDTMDNVWRVLKTVTFSIGASVAPMFSEIAKAVTDAAVKFRKYIDENRDIIRIAAIVAGGIIAVGGALVGVGVASSALAPILGVVFAAASSVVGAIGFMLSPIGAVIAALGVLGGVLLYTTGSGGAAIDWLSEKFGEIAEYSRKIFSGIVGLFSAGEFGLAAELVWSAIKVEWKSGILSITEMWYGFRDTFLNTWTGAVTTVSKMFAIALGSMSNAWEIFNEEFRKTWRGTQDYLSELMLDVWAGVTGANREDLQAALENTDWKSKAQGEANSKAAWDKVSEDLQNTLSNIESSGNAEIDARLSSTQAELNKMRAELDREKKLLDTRIIAGEMIGADVSSGNGVKEKQSGSVEDYLDQIRKAMEDSGKSLKEATRTSIAGGFGASALLGMRGTAADKAQKAAEKTAKETEKIARNTKEAIEYLRKGGPLVFNAWGA